MVERQDHRITFSEGAVSRLFQFLRWLLPEFRNSILIENVKLLSALPKIYSLC